MSGIFRKGRGLKFLGGGLALLNVLLWFCTPAIRDAVDSMSGRLDSPHRPQIMNGVQELLVYFDPWLARGVFPLIYTLGFAAIPFLRKVTVNSTDPKPGLAYPLTLTVLLVGLEALWLLLIAIGIFLRGPNWNIFWPGEAWDPHRLEVLNNINLSECFWTSWMGQPIGGLPWWHRELPGLALLDGYFITGAFIAAVLFWIDRRTPYWRWIVLVWLIQGAALVPIKMVLRWAFNLKYLVHIPEFSLNV